MSDSPTEKRSARPRPRPPAPLIGRAGNLTIFITPPPPTNIYNCNSKSNTAGGSSSEQSVSAFLRTALTKAQHVTSILDSYLADWFGLNQSKYQRELNDYYQIMQKPLKNEFGNATKPKDDTSTNEAL